MTRGFHWLVLIVVVAWGLTFAGSRTWAATVPPSVGTYVVSAGQTVHRNINMNVGTVIIRGTLDGNIHVNVGNVDVSGLVTGQVRVNTGNISLGSHGKILGNQSVGIGNDGTVGHSVLSSGFRWSHPWTHFVTGFHLSWFTQLLSRFVINGVVSGAAVFLFPRALKNVMNDMEASPLRAGATGCLVLMGWVVAMIGLAVLIIGIPLTLLLALAGVVAFFWATAAVVWLLGNRAERALWPEREVNVYLSLAIGAGMVTVLEMIPGIGWLVEVLVAAIGVGAIVRSRVGRDWPHRIVK